jgi:hypothetical protein
MSSMGQPHTLGPVITARQAIAQNPFYRPFYAAVPHWVGINGALFHLRAHLLERHKTTRAAIERQPNMREAAGIFATLGIWDPTLANAERWPVHVALGAHARFGHAYLGAIERLLQTARAWAIVEAFEVTERLILDSAAEVVRRRPEVVAQPTWSKHWPKRTPAPKIVRRRSLRDSQKLVRVFGRTEDVLRWLRHFCPTFAAGEANNVREIRFNDFLRVVAEVRHAVVHGRGVVSPRQLKKLGDQNARALETFVSGRHTRAGYALAVRDKQAEKTIQLLAEYGLLLHKQLTFQEALPTVFDRVRIDS